MKSEFDWAVVGAGPAGIATIGKLLDAGINAKKILWVDPHFTVGDVGGKWKQVPSNTKVKLFKQFFASCQSFGFESLPDEYKMSTLSDSDHCLLHEVAKPLQRVTDDLIQKVITKKGWVKHLRMKNSNWHLHLENQKLSAKNVVLAIGSQSKQLTYPGVLTISLPSALNPAELAKTIKNTDTVAVFGSSHSAVLVLKNLCELGVSHVHNFYRSPLKYALYLPNRIVFDNTGLKGSAATWARNNLDGQWPKNLSRHISNSENIQEYLTQCNKVVYAVGFSRRMLDVEGVDLSQYNDKYGIIAPGLFGIGIAFPEGKYDPFMNFEHNVGMWKFMEYLQRVFPIWNERLP